MRSVAIAAICALAITLSSGRAAPATAKAILAKAGVTGGFIVQLDGDAGLTGALRANPQCTVQGLRSDAASVISTRNALLKAGLHGPVTVATYDGKNLPYVDNLVNLVVAASRSPRSEVLRVLAPEGVAVFLDAKGSISDTVRKPRPDDIDIWTHYLHSPNNNAVSCDDKVSSPRYLHWMGGPNWSRHHDRQASTSALVTNGRQIFSIVDYGPIHTPELEPQWHVECRDAFNGIRLWTVPMKSWVSHLRRFRSGPVQLARLLLIDDNKLYVTLGIGEPVAVLDADTGKVTSEFPATKNAEEMILSGKDLLVVCGVETAEHSYSGADIFRKRIVSINTATGKPRWSWPEDAANVIPQSLAANGTSVFCQVANDTVALDQAKGSLTWQEASFAPPPAPKPQPTRANAKTKKKSKKKPSGKRQPGWNYANVVVHKDVVLSADGKKLVAHHAKTGKRLWECEASTPFGKTPSVDILVIDDVVWTSPQLTTGRDLHTGEVMKQTDLKETLVTAGHHHRCYRNKGVGNHIIYGYRGLEFFDTKGDDHARNNWIRGVCQYGVMPANGLNYIPPHNCGCYPEALLHGFWVLSGSESQSTEIMDSERLVKGPAYASRISPLAARTSRDWPTYRRDMQRSGVAAAALPEKLGRAWAVDLGGRLTAPVIAGNMVVVAQPDTCTVLALDAATGKARWTFAAGGEVDSAPTLYDGRVLFGAADGKVYCLSLGDGKLAWTFNAEPARRTVIVKGRPQSAWPISGSVLVKNGVAYCAAGNSSYLDGGMYLYGLDPSTGKVRKKQGVASAQVGRFEKPEGIVEGYKFSQNTGDYKTMLAPDRSDAFSMEGNRKEILTADEDSVYLRHMRFRDDLTRNLTPKKHLFSTGSLLDDDQAHRSHWFYGVGDFSRLNVAYEWLTRGNYGGFNAPFGHVLVFEGETVWGVYGHGEETQLFASPILPIDAEAHRDFPARKVEKGAGKPKGQPERLWGTEIPMHARALLKAGNKLYIAGATDTGQLLGTATGGSLLVASDADGSTVASLPLEAPPVFDGMAAAGSRLYISQNNGTLLCMGAAAKGK